MRLLSQFIVVGGLLFAVQSHAEERLPTIPPSQYTSEQTKASAEFEIARKGPVSDLLNR